MDQDSFAYVPPSEDHSHRRSFGGLGRGPAALLLAAGLLIGGGIGGFVVANAASPSAPAASPSAGAGGGSHPCPHMGGSSAT
jgi:hypothetical protein